MRHLVALLVVVALSHPPGNRTRPMDPEQWPRTGTRAPRPFRWGSASSRARPAGRLSLDRPGRELGIHERRPVLSDRRDVGFWIADLCRWLPGTDPLDRRRTVVEQSDRRPLHRLPGPAHFLRPRRLEPLCLHHRLPRIRGIGGDSLDRSRAHLATGEYRHCDRAGLLALACARGEKVGPGGQFARIQPWPLRARSIAVEDPAQRAPTTIASYE